MRSFWGFEGYRVDDPADVASVWDRALAAERPVLVEAIIDPGNAAASAVVEAGISGQAQRRREAEQSELARRALQALERELSVQQ
jgi:pyruvate dehydrogenase (quinone)